MQAKAEELSAMGLDVYYGVGFVKQPIWKGRAKNENVIGIPGIWLDLDLKHKTHKQQNLPTTLDEIRVKLPLDPTIIVHSGHGVHLYWLFREVWVFDSADDKKRATAILEGFQRYVRQRLGYKLDATHDLARVLRLPGTVNFKDDPAPVRIIAEDGDLFNIDDLEQYCADEQPISERADRSNFKRLPTDDVAEVVVQNCKFIRHCAAQAKTLPEPEWLAMISNVIRCADGQEKVHEFSRPYPGYSVNETDKKIIHVLNDMEGPLTCAYIQNVLGFRECPEGGCGFRSPCGWALSNKPKEKEKPKLQKFTDIGNARWFAELFKDRLKFCHNIGSWFIWDGVRYKMDEQEQVLRFATQAVQEMVKTAAELDDSDMRKALLKHATRTEGYARIKAMVELARHLLSVHVDELDNDKWLLNVNNGVLDLKTGELLPHDCRRSITKLAPVTYDPEATCEIFAKFLSDVFDGNQNIIDFMQRFLGYCLTGDTSEQQMGIAWGALGSNGKSTLFELIQDLLGDYAENTPAETFMAKKHDGIPNDIARLRGARFVSASETREGRMLNAALVKQVTGQDRITARFLRQEFFTFVPDFKLVLLTNHKPRISGDDKALGRRLLLVPFTQRFEGAKKDKKMPEKLRKELSGVLNWCLEGCLQWQEQGLCPPEEVVEATKEYQEENDVITNWIEECCIQKFEAKTAISVLYTNFCNWCGGAGERATFNKNAFTQKLVDKGYSRCRDAKGDKALQGIGLLDIKHDFQQEELDPF